ncbi:MAG: hypothetical protein ACE5H9_05440 [Anaerolineae bacterium]
MSTLANLQATRDSLRYLAGVVRSTRRILAAAVRKMQRSEWSLGEEGQRQLSDTLDHVEDVREGFILSQRTSPFASLAELRLLVEHILKDWFWLQSLDLPVLPNDNLETLGPQLIAYNHAVVALATLPHLPLQAVTFPQARKGYVDVLPPTRSDQVLERIEEIERVIYQAGMMPLNTLDYHPFRRTYAFFESSAWLVNNYLRALLAD